MQPEILQIVSGNARHSSIPSYRNQDFYSSRRTSGRDVVACAAVPRETQAKAALFHAKADMYISWQENLAKPKGSTRPRYRSKLGMQTRIYPDDRCLAHQVICANVAMAGLICSDFDYIPRIACCERHQPESS